MRRKDTQSFVIIYNNLDANKIAHIFSYNFHAFETRVEHDQQHIV
jgi:hypothetical protein